MKKITLLILALILPITTGFVFSQYTKNRLNMRIKYSAKDLQKHGITIILPSDPEFDVLAKTVLIEQNDPEFEKVKPLSIFLKNNSSKAVVAHSIIWQFIDISGKVIERKANYINSPALTDGILDVKTDGQNNESIPPNSYKFLTLAPMLNSQGGGGSGGSNSDIKSDKDSLKEVNETISIEEKRNKVIDSLYSNLLKDNNEVVVSLDGVFLEDGLYFGSNKTSFFDIVEAHVRARRDVIFSINNIMGNPVEEDKILKSLQERGEIQQKKSRDLSNPEEQYTESTRLFAAHLAKLKQISGEKGLVMEINSFNKRILPKIRKF